MSTVKIALKHRSEGYWGGSQKLSSPALLVPVKDAKHAKWVKDDVEGRAFLERARTSDREPDQWKIASTRGTGEWIPIDQLPTPEEVADGNDFILCARFYMSAAMVMDSSTVEYWKALPSIAGRYTHWTKFKVPPFPETTPLRAVTTIDIAGHA